MARMHASNTASLMDDEIKGRLHRDYRVARQRLAVKLGEDGEQEGAGPNPTSLLLNRIIDLLGAGRLTINFKPERWFENEVAFAKYGGMFEIGYNTKDAYAKTRSGAEENMFRYGSHSGPVGEAVARHGVGKVKNIGEGRQRNYVPTNPDFLGGMRPKYAALDFMFGSNGGAANSLYGKSFFELSDHIKMNATFTPDDSLHEKDSSRVANIHNLFTLVATCHDKVLDKYVKCATGAISSPAQLTPYTEAQLHSDVSFLTDIKAVHVQSLAKCSDLVRRNFDTFVRKFGLTVHSCPGSAV